MKKGIKNLEISYPFLTVNLHGDEKLVDEINTLVVDLIDDKIQKMKIRKSIDSAIGNGNLIDNGDDTFSLSLQGGISAKHLLKTSDEAREMFRKLNIAHGRDPEQGLPPKADSEGE